MAAAGVAGSVQAQNGVVVVAGGGSEKVRDGEARSCL